MKKSWLLPVLTIIVGLTGLFYAIKPVAAGPVFDTCKAGGKSDTYCQSFENCKNSNGEDQTCQAGACIADGGSASECKAGAGYFNQNLTGTITNDNPQKHAQYVANCDQTGTIDGSECYSQLQATQNVSALGMIVAGGYGPNGNLTAGGAVMAFANNIDWMLKTRPASSVDYIAYLGDKLRVPGAPQTAYAAGGGLGFSKLSPVLPIWTLMRNIAYLVFAIIFIVTGVMIMFRVKIDPKTAASIQASLPKIIFSLVLVTFSYAIAGFLIDIMYVSLALILTIMSTIVADSGKSFEKLLSGSIFEFIMGGWLGTTDSVSRAVAGIINGIFSNLLTGVGGTITGLIAYGLAFLIVGIAILWALFKTWLSLIGAYAGIILSIIFSPLQLMLDAIPGQNQFSGWIRGLLANLLAFPVVTIMMAIGGAIATNFGKGFTDPGAAASGFVPPLIGAGNQQTAQAFIGLGILLTIPKVTDMLREIFKAPMNKYGTAWGEAIGFGQARVGGAAGRIGRGVGEEYFGEPIRRWDEYSKTLGPAVRATPPARVRVGRFLGFGGKRS